MAQITLQNTINEIQGFASAHTLIQTYEFGRMDIVFNSQIVYPYWRLNYYSTIVSDKRVTYNFKISCSYGKQHDNSDLISKYSLTESVLLEFITYMKYSSRFHNIYKIELPARIYAAESSYLDGVPTSVLDLSISVDRALCLSEVQIEGGAL
jgi:hypothetical protein